MPGADGGGNMMFGNVLHRTMFSKRANLFTIATSIAAVLLTIC